MRLNKSIYVEKSVILNSSRVHKNNRYVHKILPEFSRNSVEIFHGIPSEFFMKKPTIKTPIIGFRSKKDALETMNQMKGLIAPHLDDLSSSNPTYYNYAAVATLALASVLAAI